MNWYNCHLYFTKQSTKTKSLNTNNQKCKKKKSDKNQDSIQIIKIAKRNRYKRTNEQLYSKPLQPFLKGTETKYEMNLPMRVH